MGVTLRSTGVGGELLPFFGRLGALQYLRSGANPALAGDVADLAGATELRKLDLYGCPLVVGEIAALAVLVHLGEPFAIPCVEGSWYNPTPFLTHVPRPFCAVCFRRSFALSGL